MYSGAKEAIQDVADMEVREEAEARDGKGGDPMNVLAVLKAQRERAIGLDNDDGELQTERADALDYYKGKHEGAIARDLPALPNRSSVVSTDVSNAVETALPELIDIFTGGEDTITIKPQGMEDIEAAKQETDYLRHILFQQNDGWVILYTGFKDALISKTGLFSFEWYGQPEYEEYTTLASEPQIEEIVDQGNELIEMVDSGTVNVRNFPVFKVTFRKIISDGHVCVRNVAPENFAVSPETVGLADSNYCVERRSDTRQNLIDQGYDKDLVMKLDRDEIDETERMARDTVNEETNRDEGADALTETVDILIHYVRLDIEGTGRPQIWRIVTGNDESIELEREKRSMIQYAAITPYPMTHRFYGQSLADKLIQTQKWKTTVTRQVNDHLYFSNNQRQEVKFAGVVPGVTIEQLTDNSPGQPVITQDGNSLKPIQNGSLGVDVMGLLEYVNVDAEMRTGIVRNAQGLKPDTMHETADGANMLLTMSQKRIRMMARLFAETGLRYLFMGIHDLARQNATMKDTIELRNEWVDIDPSSWKRRKDFNIKIGIGSGGKEATLMALREWRGVLASLVEAQGGMEGPLVTPQNIYNSAVSYGEALDIKDARLQITNPEKAAAEKAAKGETEQPEVPPEVQVAMMEMEIEKQTSAAKIQLETEKAKTQAAIDMAKAKEQAALNRQNLEAELELERMRAAAKLEIERQEAAAKLQLAREEAQLKADLARESAEFEAALAERNAEREYELAKKQAAWKAETDHQAAISKNRPGGDLSK